MSDWGRNNPKQVRKTSWTVEEAEEKNRRFLRLSGAMCLGSAA